MFLSGFSMLELIRSLPRQIVRILPTLLFCTVLGALPVLFIVYMHEVQEIGIGKMVRDLAAIERIPPYTGMLTWICGFLWVGGATAFVICASVLRRLGGDAKMIRMLVLAGALSFMLGFDDAFMLHEEVLPAFGISEKTVLVTYGGVLMAILLLHMNVFLRSDFIILGAGLGFFALSVGVDHLIQEARGYLLLIEDGGKMFGIVLWDAFYIRTALLEVSALSVVRQTQERTLGLPGAAAAQDSERFAAN